MSFTVTGPITSAAGSIWVWAEKKEETGYQNHYEMLKQFAVLADGLMKADAVDTTKITEAQLAATYAAFRNAQDNEITNCGGDYLTGQKGEVARYIYWTGGFDVIFLKLDGFGAALPGATFTLYKNKECTDPFEMSFLDGKRSTSVSVTGDGTEKYKDASGAEQTLKKGEVLLAKIPPKTFYLKETAVPTKDPSGNDFVYKLDETIYEVAFPADTDPSYSEGIQVSDGVVVTIKKKSSAESATYDVNQYKQNVGTETAPVYQYAIMNTSAIERRVMLRMVSDTNASLSGALFKILKADMTELVTADYDTTRGGYLSQTSGIYFSGKLPVGTYYLVEIQAPGATYSANKVFELSVTATGSIAAPTEHGPYTPASPLPDGQTTAQNLVKQYLVEKSGS